MGRGPYLGSTRKLLLSFDIGTTFSGVSYSILEPGEAPETKTVTRFPAVSQAGNDCKIPSILYYDNDGTVQAIGAEAVTETVKVDAEEKGWTKVEWFKLHLRPKKGEMGQLNIPALRADLDIVKVFSDYIKYLYDCSKTYIRETARITGWESVERSIDYVFTHPNGWEGPQQSQMRQAAVKAGLIPDDEEGHARISFVTEGEASLHFCVNNGFSADKTEQGEGIIVIDAGGGTIDISSYCGKRGQYAEISPPLCALQGSIFVTRRAEDHLKDLLRGSAFEDDIPNILNCFDQGVKPIFRSDTDLQYVQFGGRRDHAPDQGIRNGKLRLTGPIVASFFQPSIEYIVKSVKEQCLKLRDRQPIKTVVLVGGFATSDWLFKKLEDGLRSDGVSIYRPNGSRNKAASDGGISYYLDRLVNRRATRATYGTKIFEEYDPGNSRHAGREHLTRIHDVTRKRCFFDMFSPILNKGDVVEETEEFRSSYGSYVPSRTIRGTISIPIIRYRGSEQHFISMKNEAESFDNLCNIEVDASKLPIREEKETGCYQLYFQIVLPFGLTELKAQVAWTDPSTGEEARTAANVVYEDD